MKSFLSTSQLSNLLEKIFSRFHRVEYIDPDPLSRVRKYPQLKDRELVAFLCASLALGRVGGILTACDSVLGSLGTSPKETLLGATRGDLSALLQKFRYRFFGPSELVAFLYALRQLLTHYGSIEECFHHFAKKDSNNLLAGIQGIFHSMSTLQQESWGILLSDPSKGGGMKRWHLFLRWMVRKDQIDPGGWDGINPSVLQVPVDTHLHAWGLRLGLTQRKTIDRTTVEEVTDAFRRVDPLDPVRFDFSLSRVGIHPDAREEIEADKIHLVRS